MSTLPTFKITQEVINECLEAALEEININEPNAHNIENTHISSK